MYFYNIDQCLKIMKILGAFPNNKGSKTQTFLYCLHMTFTIAIYYLFVQWFLTTESVVMMDFIDSVSLILFFIHGSINLSTLFLRRASISNILETMTSRFWNIEAIEDVNERQTYLDTTKFLELKFKVYSRFLLFDVFVFLYEESARKGELTPETYPVNLYFPERLPVVAVIIFNTAMSYVMMLSMIVTDVLIFTSVTLTELQFKMLNYKLRNCFNDTEVNINKVDNWSESMRQCNDHMTFLLQTLLNDTFSPLLLLYVGVIVLSLCVTLFAVSDQDSIEDALRAFAHGTGFFFQFMVSYCIPIQSLVDEAEKTAGSIFASDWYNSPDNYKNTLILTGKAQQRVYLTAGGLVDVDHQSGLAALKTVISYWGFLRTVGANQT